jgi:branched-chain amino acid aminotransferase
MKAYKSGRPGAKAMLFRPDMNMARMRRSAERVQLPVSVARSFKEDEAGTFRVQDFDPDALIELISKLVKIDEHLIPPPPCALYMRPTL